MTQIDLKKLFGSFQDIGGLQEKTDGSETRWEWPKELGSGFMTMIKIRPGLILGIARYRLKQDLTIHFEQEYPLIDFGFCISGNVAYSISHEKGRENAFHYKYRHSTINCLPPCRGAGLSSSKTHIACIRIYTAPPVLHGLLSGCREAAPGRLYDIAAGDAETYYGRMAALSPPCHAVAAQILDCPYRGALRRLYLESKTLELIAHTMAQFSDPGPVSGHGASLCPDDLERISRAERLLNRNIGAPPSLTGLARQVGLNKNKLNRGFRQQFGTSVFGHLRALRMEQARKLLKSREKNVTEVAFDVGYAHHGNFTRAFKKHFGTNPQDLLA